MFGEAAPVRRWRMLRAVALAVAMAFLGSWNMEASETVETPAAIRIACGGIGSRSCEFDQRRLHECLKRIRVFPEGWNWVIVGRQRWQRVATQFHVRDSVPAFSNFTVRTTYIHEAFFALNTTLQEILQPYDAAQGTRGLDWAVSHELRHILCHTSDEKRAETAGARLRVGEKQSRICAR